MDFEANKRRIVYIAAPFGASTKDEMRRNVARAVALGRLAVRQGLVPIVPHAIGALGVYGAADESEEGVREAAIECGVALAASCPQMWLLKRGDGSISSGCQLERAAAAGAGASILIGSWESWKEDFHAGGLIDLWLEPLAYLERASL